MMPTSQLFYLAMGVIAIILLALPWKVSFWLAFTVMITEGVIRTWIIPEHETVAFFIKDVLLGIAYLRFLLDVLFGSVKRQHAQYPLIPVILIALFTIWVVAQTIHTRTPDVVLALFGARTYLYYIPIFFLVPYVFRSKKQMFTVLTMLSLSMIPIGILGILQFYGPIELGEKNIFLTYVNPEKVAFVGTETQYPRITGTLPYIAPYNVYLFFTGMLTMLLIWIRYYKHTIIQSGLYISLALIYINSFMTGSRSGVYLLTGGLVLFFILALIRETIQYAFNKHYTTDPTIIRRIGYVTVPILIFFIAVFVSPLREAPRAFFERVESSGDTETRFSRPVIMPLVLATVHTPFGIGVGITHQAGSRIVEGYDAFSVIPKMGGEYDTWFEEEPPRIATELGFPGLLIIYGIHLSFALLFLGHLVNGNNVALRSFGAAGIVLVIGLIMEGVIFSSTSYMLYLLLVGTIPILPYICKEEHPA